MSADDPFVVRALCYPRPWCAELEERIRLLESTGVESLAEGGKDIGGLRVVGKGHSSIVVKALTSHHGIVALKVRRLDSKRASLEWEGRALEIAGDAGISPRPFAYSRDFVLMELLPESFVALDLAIGRLLSKANVEGLRALLYRTLRAARAADAINLEHGELANASDHVLTDGANVRIIDWESSRIGQRGRNVSQLCSYLLFRLPFSGEVIRLFEIRLEEVLQALREYKSVPNDGGFERLLQALKLLPRR
ncbi:MAG: hypothetical protein ABWK00_04885 [Desulfurococcaceae archaeon]